MKFNWKGLLLAPLLVPLVFGLVMTISMESRSPLLSLFVLFAIGSVLSYGATICLFLPCLYLLSKFTALTAYLTCGLGAVLGALAYLPYAWVAYRASGDNSGPPQGNFAEYLGRESSDPVLWALFPFGGLLTAAVYWMLVRSQPQRGEQP